jgi:hypothetical protein
LQKLNSAQSKAVMAVLVTAIHVFVAARAEARRGCPAQHEKRRKMSSRLLPGQAALKRGADPGSRLW